MPITVAIVRRGPTPGSVPVGARHQDFLHRPGAADGGDRGIGGAEPHSRALHMRLVHQPEDHAGIGLEVAGELAPQIGKGRIGRLRAADQRAETETVIVQFDFDLEALAGGIVHDIVEPAELRCVEWSGLSVLDALPEERQPHDAHALGSVIIDLGMGRVGVVGAENPRVGVSKSRWPLLCRKAERIQLRRDSRQ